jgi:hypothetical protein
MKVSPMTSRSLRTNKHSTSLLLMPRKWTLLRKPTVVDLKAPHTAFTQTNWSMEVRRPETSSPTNIYFRTQGLIQTPSNWRINKSWTLKVLPLSYQSKTNQLMRYSAFVESHTTSMTSIPKSKCSSVKDHAKNGSTRPVSVSPLRQSAYTLKKN